MDVTRTEKQTILQQRNLSRYDIVKLGKGRTPQSQAKVLKHLTTNKRRTRKALNLETMETATH